MVRVAIKSLGCKVNQAEIQNLLIGLANYNVEIVDFDSQADFLILNACSVTGKAQGESKRLVRQFAKNNLQAKIILTGCLSDKFIPDEVDLFIKNSDKQNLLAKIETFAGLKKLNNKEALSDLRTRGLVKIQQGCNNFCTYCIVPYLRGRERSISPDKIINEIKNLERQGYREIVLVGTNIARYDFEKIKLADLIKQILQETKIERIRLSSFWPTEIDDELLDLFENRRMCRYFHLSVQSGSDKILQKMNRNYGYQDILKIAQKIKTKIPQANLTADFIVGFPGETEKDFEQTYRLCQQVGFYKVHVFRYSKRSGTRAAEFDNQVDEQVKKDRAKKLRELSRQQNLISREELVGTKISVLVEHKNGKYCHGLSDNYVKVYFENKADLFNQIVELKITEIYRDGLLGKFD